MNNWKEIWDKRSADSGILHSDDEKKIFLELKRSNGFDVLHDGLTYDALYAQYVQTRHMLTHNGEKTFPAASIYEVGCGSGSNLYLFEKDGFSCGGIDYSSNLINSAREILSTKDLICDEASRLPVTPKYDCILSNSVFSYFEDETYAKTVLEKIYEKANYSIGIIDIHDINKKEDFIAYRKREVENYEERYRNLPKLFYSKEFFQAFAEEHTLSITFTESAMDNYWNNDFIFHCYMYR